MKSVNLKQSVCPSLSQSQSTYSPPVYPNLSSPSPYSPSLSHKLAGPIEHPSFQPFFANLIVYQKSTYNSPLWSKRKPFTSNTCTWSSLAGITFAPQTKLSTHGPGKTTLYPILSKSYTASRPRKAEVYPCLSLYPSYISEYEGVRLRGIIPIIIYPTGSVYEFYGIFTFVNFFW